MTAAVVSIIEAAGVDGHVGASRRRRGRAREARLAASRRAHRLDPPQQGRAEGAGHDAGRRRVYERQRRAAQGARPVREPSAGREPPERALAIRERRPRHRAREHRRPVLGPRARSRSGRGREPEDHHRARVDAHRAFRVRLRGAHGTQAHHRDPQGEHHEDERRPVHPMRPHRRRHASRTSPTTSRSSTRRA